MAREIADPRVGFATITKVETTRDLSHARVLVSVIGQPEERKATIAALRRAMPLLGAVIVAFLAVAALPLALLEVALLTAVFACFWLFEAERSPRTLDLFVVAAATFAAPAALIKLSTGPLVAVVLLVALIGVRAGARRLVAYVLLFLVEVAVLWLATGQSFGDVGAFLSSPARSTALISISLKYTSISLPACICMARWPAGRLGSSFSSALVTPLTATFTFPPCAEISTAFHSPRLKYLTNASGSGFWIHFRR